VPLSRLIAAAWDGDPPATAARQVRNRVADLRALLTRERGVHRHRGVRLPAAGQAPATSTRSSSRTCHARAGYRRRRPDARRVALWRGPALDGLCGERLGGERVGGERVGG
jgi:hypothetical protein